MMGAPKGNKYAVGNNGGRPALFKNEAELSNAVESYFEYIKGVENKKTAGGWDRYPEPPTITGLALFLGFDSRQSLYEYEEKGNEFTCIIKRARLKVENGYEKNLHGSNNTGSIFALKNMGWKDTSTVNVTKVGKDLADETYV